MSTTDRKGAPAAADAEGAAPRRAWAAAGAAWLIPGLGHFVLGRRLRGLLFCAVVLSSLAIGCALEGTLYTFVRERILTYLAAPASMGMGLAYFVLRFVLDYRGDVVAGGYEYGTAFILSAGLMNLLLVLDAWDIACGRKE